MRVRNPLDNRQPKPAATTFRFRRSGGLRDRTRRFDAIEPIEQVRKMIRSDARPIVAH